MADNKEVEKILDIHVNYADALKGIQKYKEELARLKEVEKELDKNSEGYEEELELISAKRREAQAEIRGLRKEIQNNIKQEKAQEGSLKQLRAALSNATKAYDEMSRVERESAKGKELENHIKDITKELKGAEEETERFYRNVGNYKNSILEAIGLNGGFGSSLVEMAENGKGVGGFFANVTTSVKAFGASLLGLLTNPVFLAIAGIAGAGVAFKWWYDYNKGLVEATRLTKTLNQDMSGDELKTYRNDIQAVADMWGKDFKEVLLTTNTLVKQFGIDGREAISLIADGFALDADISGEFLEQVKEYAPFFKEAGVSAEQFIAVSVKASKEGVFGDKALDSIKEALIRLREMPQATKDALSKIGLSAEALQTGLADGTFQMMDVIKMVSDRLQNFADDSPEVGQALADIFGGPGEDAGVAYIKMLGDMSVELGGLKEEAGQFYSLQMEQLESQNRLQDAMSGLFDATGGSFEEMTAKAKIFVNDALAGILTYIKDAIDYVRDLYRESEGFRAVVVTIGRVCQLVFTGITEQLRGMLETMKFIGSVWKGVWTLDWQAVEDGWNNYVQVAMESALKVGQAWQNVWSKIDMPMPQDNGSTMLPEVIITGKRNRNKGGGGSGSGSKAVDEVKARYEAMKDEISKEAELIRKRLELVKMEADERYRIKMELLEKERQLDIMRITEEYTNEEQRRKALELLTIEYDQKEQAIRKEKSDAIWAEVTAQGEAMLDAVIKSEDAVTKTKEKYAEEQKKIEQDKVKALTLLTGSLSDLAFEAAEDNEALAGVAKGLAIANILIAQGEAIANAVKTATRSSATWWEIAGAIGTVVATVTSVMRTAMKSVNSAKVGGSRGGGGGASMGGYSSSAVFNPLLSSFNSFGQNIQTYGGQNNRGEMMSEEMMADAVSRGVLTSPAPVVSVVEITEAQRRVKVIEETDAV